MKLRWQRVEAGAPVGVIFSRGGEYEVRQHVDAGAEALAWVAMGPGCDSTRRYLTPLGAKRACEEAAEGRKNLLDVERSSRGGRKTR